MYIILMAALAVLIVLVVIVVGLKTGALVPPRRLTPEASSDKMESEPNVEIVSTEVLETAFEESRKTLEIVAQAYDGVDSKVVAVFGVSTVIAGLAPTFIENAPSGVGLLLWIASLIAWSVSAGFCFLAFKPRAYRIDPIPSALLDTEWLELEEKKYLYYRIRDMAKSFDQNTRAQRAKVTSLRWAIAATTGEVALLALALMFGA